MLNGLVLFLTGLSLFLFGMMKLSSSMQQSLGARIRNYIKFSVKNPVYGLLTGIGATVVFQSSSATTLLTVGIVSAGLISFYNSLGIILGADLGTTLTAQLVVWKVTDISPFIVFAGVMMYLSGKKTLKTTGEMVVYFGLIFYGLSLAGEAAAPLKENEWFLAFFREEKNPLLGLAVGILFTAVVQASAIPIGILVILGQQGLVTIENALPVVLGANIGTTATAIFGSIFMGLAGRRSAVSHLLFKCFGVAVCLLLLPALLKFVKMLSTGVPQQVAYSHVIVSIVIVVLFFGVLKPFSRFIERMMPGHDQALPLWPEHLDSACLSSPEKALECVRKELSREIMLSMKMLEDSVPLITKWSETKKRDVMYTELVVDNLQEEITKFLWNVSCGMLSQELSKKLFAFSVIVYDIERIADRSTNIVELAESKHKRNAHFTGHAYDDLDVICPLVARNVADAATLLERKDRALIGDIKAVNEEVMANVREATKRHLDRFYTKMCQAEAGPLFVGILTNLQVISDHCRIIAEHIESLDEA